MQTLIGHFNVNVAWSDEVDEYLKNFADERVEALKREYMIALRNQKLGKEQFYRATSCKARDEQSAHRFFEDVYKYAFEGGKEPDVTDYWDRPKSADW